MLYYVQHFQLLCLLFVVVQVVNTEFIRVSFFSFFLFLCLKQLPSMAGNKVDGSSGNEPKPKSNVTDRNNEIKDAKMLRGPAELGDN